MPIQAGGKLSEVGKLVCNGPIVKGVKVSNGSHAVAAVVGTDPVGVHEGAFAVAAIEVVAIPAAVLKQAHDGVLFLDDVVIYREQGVDVLCAMLAETFFVIDEVDVFADDVNIFAARRMDEFLPFAGAIPFVVDAVVRTAADGDFDGLAAAVFRVVVDVGKAFVRSGDMRCVPGGERDLGFFVNCPGFEGVDEQGDFASRCAIQGHSQFIAFLNKDSGGIFEFVEIMPAVFILPEQGSRIPIGFSFNDSRFLQGLGTPCFLLIGFCRVCTRTWDDCTGDKTQRRKNSVSFHGERRVEFPS